MKPPSQAVVAMSLRNEKDLLTVGATLSRQQTVLNANRDATVSSLIPSGAGGLLLTNFAVDNLVSTPPNQFSLDPTYPWVLLFAEAHGRRLVTVTLEGEITGNPGATIWSLGAEVGTNLASATPDPPLFVVSRQSETTNASNILQVDFTFVPNVPFPGIQAQNRLVHDDVGAITIVWTTFTIVDVGLGTGAAVQSS